MNQTFEILTEKFLTESMDDLDSFTKERSGFFKDWLMKNAYPNKSKLAGAVAGSACYWLRQRKKMGYFPSKDKKKTVDYVNAKFRETVAKDCIETAKHLLFCAKMESSEAESFSA